MGRRTLWTLVMVMLFTSVAVADEYYLSDDKAYWWYWDGPPSYEVMVPSKAETYVSQRVFDERTLEITFSKNGPVMRVASLVNARGGYATLKKAVLDRWQHVWAGVKMLDDKEITTSRGVKAHFLTATGITPAGNTMMLRTVAFFKGADVVYLQLMCYEKEFTGTVHASWIKAVNTFNWR